ncbi:MAG: sugar transferase [Haloechinothrix sp.]
MSEQVESRAPEPGAALTPTSRFAQATVADWEPRYRRLVIFCDVAAVVLVVGVVGAVMRIRHPSIDLWELTQLDVVTVLTVLGSLGVSRVWHPVVLGQGAEEFSRLGRGLFAALVALGLGALAMAIPGARLWVFAVVPAIMLVIFPMRYLLRRLLHRARSAGQCLLPVLVAGNVYSVRDLIQRTRKAPHVGWRVEGICTFTGRAQSGVDVDGVPVVGQLRDLAEHVRRGGYRIVAITPDRYWTPERLQRLAWNLEGSGTEMVIDPGMMEVAGPRLHISGVLGMPLLRVSEPAFTGFPRAVKALVDRSGAALLLMLLSPLMLAVAAAIKLDSRGPVLYRQRRVGKGEAGFTMIKFRTMVEGADAFRSSLAAENEGAGLLFKMRRDPRITRVGSLLRRYSIDELPQLFNVLSGSMSLVGPRPPLPEECAQYPPDVRRRLLVKPGVTGLWQVSGRSDLSWDESVRLDLRYVEDWSLALDAVILWKTARAVLGGEGAY